MAVRREKVVLDLEDNLTPGLTRSAVAAKLLERNLKGLDGTSVGAGRGLMQTSRSVDAVNTSFRRGAADIDQFSGRLRLFADAALTIGPALIPIGAIGIPALTGLASAFGFTAVGAGAAAVAFSGVGDALDALRKAQLEPTTENLKAARQAMDQIGPHAQAFAEQLVAMGPAFREVRDSAAAGLFPGLQASLVDVERVLPRVASLFQAVGDAVGDLAADGADSLAGPRWAGFISFIEAEAPAALRDLGSALGSTAHGFAEMWMAFQPLNDSFVGWLRESAAAFDQWSVGLSQSQGFAEFSEYIRENGPRVAEAMSSIGNALLQVVQAAAPLGGPTLAIISALADTLALLAASPVGPPLLALAAGMTAVSRATSIAGPAMASMSDAFLDLRTSPNKAATAMERFGGAARVAAGGVGIGLFAHSLTQANDSLRVFESTFGGALAGLSTGSPWGVAIGAAGGLLAGLAGTADDTTEQVQALTNALIQANGVIDDTFRGGVAAALEESGAASAAQELGIDLNALTNAALGAEPALAQMNAVLDQQAFALTGAAIATLQSGDATREQLQVARQTIDAAGPQLASIKLIRDALGGQNEVVDEATAKAQRHAEMMGTAAGATDEYTGATQDSIGALEAAAAATWTFSDALAGLEGWLNRREAARNYAESIKELARSLKNGFTRKDAENIDAVGRSIMQMAQGMKKGPRDDFLKGTIASLRELANNSGPRAKAEVAGLIAQLRKLIAPKKPITPEVNDGPAKSKLTGMERLLKQVFGKDWRTKLNVDNTAAQAAINNIKTALSNIPDETVFVSVRRTGGDQVVSARGNFLTFANGGMDGANRHSPEFAGPGPTRVWREPETGGESYIPHANDGRRPRAESILAQTADLFGMRVMKYAQGGYETNTRPPTGDMSPYSSAAMGGLFGATMYAGNALLTFGQWALEDAKRARIEARLDLKMAERQRDSLRETVDHFRELRDSIREARDSLASSLGVKGGVDIFGDGATIQSAMAGLGKNETNAGLLQAAVERLTAAGFSGPALSALLEQGGFDTIIRFSQATSDDLQMLSQQFGQSAYAQNAAGMAGGNAVYGAQLTAAAGNAAAYAAELKVANAHARESAASLKAAEKTLEEVSKKLDRVTEAAAVKGPDRFADAIKGPSRSAAQRNGRR